MKNEPVAWMPIQSKHTRIVEAKPDDEQNWIPLYLHPVKELTLTGEEMISIYEKDWSGIKCGLGRAVEQAILRKASEK
jgi:hypothetical protein